MAAADFALPTLLCSRPRATATAEQPSKPCRPRPVPAPLDAVEEPTDARLPALRIKNTFLEGADQLSPSLSCFYQVRAVQTCPSKHAGRFASLTDDFANDTGAPAVVSPTCTPLALATPCSIQTPLADGCAYPQQVQFGPTLDMSALPMPRQCAIEAPCSFVMPRAEDAMQVHAYQPFCEMPLAFPSSLQQGHDKLILPEVPFAAAGQMMPQSESPAGMPVRKVLSLADALGGEDSSPLAAASSAAPQALAGQVLGASMVELPSLGSGDHARGCCKPCAFLHTRGCENGLACKFCHICGPEERKRRRHDKANERREQHRVRREKTAPQGAGRK